VRQLEEVRGRAGPRPRPPPPAGQERARGEGGGGGSESTAPLLTRVSTDESRHYMINYRQSRRAIARRQRKQKRMISFKRHTRPSNPSSTNSNFKSAHPRPQPLPPSHYPHPLHRHPTPIPTTASDPSNPRCTPPRRGSIPSRVSSQRCTPPTPPLKESGTMLYPLPHSLVGRVRRGYS